MSSELQERQERELRIHRNTPPPGKQKSTSKLGLEKRELHINQQTPPPGKQKVIPNSALEEKQKERFTHKSNHITSWKAKTHVVNTQGWK